MFAFCMPILDHRSPPGCVRNWGLFVGNVKIQRLAQQVLGIICGQGTVGFFLEDHPIAKDSPDSVIIAYVLHGGFCRQSYFFDPPRYTLRKRQGYRVHLVSSFHSEALACHRRWTQGDRKILFCERASQPLSQRLLLSMIYHNSSSTLGFADLEEPAIAIPRDHLGSLMNCSVDMLG